MISPGKKGGVIIDVGSVEAVMQFKGELDITM